jgi:hypothetical protein
MSARPTAPNRSIPSAPQLREENGRTIYIPPSGVRPNRNVDASVEQERPNSQRNDAITPAMQQQPNERMNRNSRSGYQNNSNPGVRNSPTERSSSPSYSRPSSPRSSSGSSPRSSGSSGSSGGGQRPRR